MDFEPQSYEQLKARFPECMKEVWDLNLVRAGVDRPGLHREHVFDTDDGLRLIVSVDRDGDLKTLHVSCSIANIEKWRDKFETALKANIPKRIAVEMAFSKITLEAFKKLSNLSETGIAHSFLEGDVLHLVYPLDK